jgi:hypothetical protein
LYQLPAQPRALLCGGWGLSSFAVDVYLSSGVVPIFLDA